MTAPQDGSVGPPDEQLVQRARAGSADAVHALVDRFGVRLYRTALRLVGHDADAQDVVQETLLGMIKGIAKFDGRSRFQTWLWSILVRQAARHHRSQRPRPRLEAAVDAGTRGGESASDARLDVAAALEQLSVEHRQVIVLREMDGLAYADIAQVLGVPRGTVESRLHRARHELRRLLTDYGTQEDQP